MQIEPSTITRIRRHIACDELANVFDLLSTFETAEIILLQGRFNAICKEMHLGTTAMAEVILEKNKIRAGLMFFLENSLEPNSKFQIPRPETENKPVLEETEISNETIIEAFSYDPATLEYIPPFLPFEKPSLHLSRRIGKKKVPDFFDIQSGETAKFDWINELKQNKYFVLLGDAGMGKSHELKWLCHELKDGDQFIPIFEALRNKTSLAYIPDFPQDIEEKIVLVFDGLDESDINESKIAIEDFKNRHPNSKIIVSCRSNTYADTLQGFEVVYLQKLGYSEIKNYVNKKLGRFGGDFLEQWRKRQDGSANRLIDNPFFLVSICEFVEDNNNRIPETVGEVFEYLIEKSLSRCIKNLPVIEGIIPENLQVACRKSLEKVSFIMESRGENILSSYELDKLINNEYERKILLEKSSLIELKENSYQFFHNNFQEYLAAKVLSRAKKFADIKLAIAAKPDYKRLKWSWTNALSFLIVIWDNSHSMKEELFEWLIQYDLDALIKIASFEKEKVSKTDRERIFKLVFEDCKRNDSIVGFHHYRYWELAEFGESPDIVRYLVEELRNAKTSTVKCNALALLKSMNSYSVLPKIRASLRKELLSNIYDFNINTSAVRQYAMLALIELFDDIEKEDAVKMVETFFNSDNAQERTATYLMIERQNLQIDFMIKLVQRSKQLNGYAWRQNEVRLVDEGWQIERCLENIKSEKGLICFFENYGEMLDDEDGWNGGQESVNLMLKKLVDIELSQEGALRIFESMKGVFADHFSHHSQAGEVSITLFLEKNKLESRFVKYCVENGQRIDIASQFLEENSIKYLIQRFKKGKIERKWLETYIYWATSNKKLLVGNLVQKLNRVSVEPFVVPEIKPAKDYAETEKRRRLIEKRLYFNKEKFISTIAEIFEKHGKEFSSKREIYHFRQDISGSDGDVFEKYPNSLIWYIEDHIEMSKQELISKVNENWGWVSISQIKSFLIREKGNITKYPESELNEQEKTFVKTWCDQHQRKMDLSKNVTNGDIVFAWFTIYCGFCHYPEEVYEQMIGSTLQNYLDVNLLDFLESREVLSIQKIKKAVLKFLGREENGGYGVYQSLKFVEKHKIQEVVEFLPHFIETKNERFDNRDTALDVYLSLGGRRDYILELFENIPPEQNDFREQRLLDYFVREPKEDFEKILLKKLFKSTSPELQLNYARYFIKCGNIFGLQFLVKYIEREKKTPFSDYIRNTELRLETPLAIPLLLRLFDFAYDKSIPQDSFDRVSNFARQMLQHLAFCQHGKYFPLIINALQEHLMINKWAIEFGNSNVNWFEAANPEGLKEIQSFAKDLEFQHFQKQEVLTEDALELFEKF